MADLELPFSARFGFAFAAFFRILFDGVFARRLWSAREQAPALPEASPSEDTPAPEAAAPVAPTANDAPSKNDLEEGALLILSLLQREGRLIDFLQQEIVSFSDADVGAAARAVHEGARRTLRAHVTIEPVSDQAEGRPITLPPGFDADAIKLTGNVRGSAPHTGTLKHPGWKVTSVSLPRAVGDHDAKILAPAEVEL